MDKLSKLKKWTHSRSKSDSLMHTHCIERPDDLFTTDNSNHSTFAFEEDPVPPPVPKRKVVKPREAQTDLDKLRDDFKYVREYWKLHKMKSSKSGDCDGLSEKFFASSITDDDPFAQTSRHSAVASSSWFTFDNPSFPEYFPPEEDSTNVGEECSSADEWHRQPQGLDDVCSTTVHHPQSTMSSSTCSLEPEAQSSHKCELEIGQESCSSSPTRFSRVRASFRTNIFRHKQYKRMTEHEYLIGQSGDNGDGDYLDEVGCQQKPHMSSSLPASPLTLPKRKLKSWLR